MTRTTKQQTLREIFSHLASSHLGLSQTNGQLKAAARKLYDRHKLKSTIIVPKAPAKFFWDNNNANS